MSEALCEVCGRPVASKDDYGKPLPADRPLCWRLVSGAIGDCYRIGYVRLRDAAKPVLAAVSAYDAASARREHLGSYGIRIQETAQDFAKAIVLDGEAQGGPPRGLPRRHDWHICRPLDIERDILPSLSESDAAKARGLLRELLDIAAQGGSAG